MPLRRAVLVAPKARHDAPHMQIMNMSDRIREIDRGDVAMFIMRRIGMRSCTEGVMQGRKNFVL